MFSNVIAIVRLTDLEKVEKSLRQAEVRGITVTRVKGYGEYKNFFSPDWKVGHARIEIFTARAEEVAETIMNAAHSGSAGDGVVAIVPIAKLYRIRDRSEVTAGKE